MSEHLLVVFATRYGTSRRLAERVAGRATEAGITVTLRDLADGPGTLDAEITRVVVVGAVYSNQHDGAVLSFLQTHREALNARRCGLVSVSLAAAIPTDEGESMTFDYVDELCRLTGFAPKDVLTTPGALDESRYDTATAALLRVATWRTQLQATGDRSFVDEAALDAAVRRWFSGRR